MNPLVRRGVACLVAAILLFAVGLLWLTLGIRLPLLLRIILFLSGPYPVLPIILAVIGLAITSLGLGRRS